VRADIEPLHLLRGFVWYAVGIDLLIVPKTSSAIRNLLGFGGSRMPSAAITGACGVRTVPRNQGSTRRHPARHVSSMTPKMRAGAPAAAVSREWCRSSGCGFSTTAA
jgi:hypothetical protein